MDLRFRLGRNDQNTASVPAFLVVSAVAVASCIPFVFLVATSFKPVDGPPGALWTQLFDQMDVGSYMLNSSLVSVGATIVVLVTSCMAGYGFAKLHYPGSSFVLLVIIATISVPMATTILPNYLNFAKVGGIGTYWGPIAMYATIATPFSTVLMTNFFRALPDELMESAVVDGASYVQIFTAIMVRLAAPALVTVGVLCFLTTWNDLLIGLLFLPDPDMRTMSVGVAALQGVRNANIDIVLTGSLLSAIPPIITFILFERYIVAGLTAGMIK